MPPRRTLYNFDTCIPGIESRIVMKVRLPEEFVATLWISGETVVPDSKTGIDEKFQFLDHGTNFFDELERQLHVVMVCGQTSLEIHQLVQVIIAFRFDMDIDVYAKSEEASTLLDNLATWLEIPPTRLREVSVHAEAGSTIVEFAIRCEDSKDYNSTLSADEINVMARKVRETDVATLQSQLKTEQVAAVQYVIWASGTAPIPKPVPVPFVVPLWMIGVIIGSVGAGLILLSTFGVVLYRRIMAFQEQIDEDEHADKEIVFPDFAQPTGNMDKVFDVVKKETGEMRTLKISVAGEGEEGKAEGIFL